MTKLLNLTIKIDNANKYDKVEPGVVSINPSRLIEVSGIEIKDQHGAIVTELKNSGSPGAAKIPVNNIKNIKLSIGVFDIPISWAWEKRGAGEIEFTLKKLKYDETWGGLNFGRVSSTGTGTAVNTLFLVANNFEGFETFKDKK